MTYFQTTAILKPKPIIYTAYVWDYTLPIIKISLAHGHALLGVIHNATENY